MNEINLQNGKKIWLSIESVRRFNINTNHNDVEIVRDNDLNFVEMKFSNLLSFKKGDKITIKDNDTDNYLTFILNDVSCTTPNKSYSGIEEKLTKTSIFILPLLKNNFLFFDYNYSLYNVYISEDYKTLYLKYKFVNTEKYLSLEENLQKHPDFIEFFDQDREFVVFKFRIIDSKVNNYFIRLILEGKYSSVLELYKLQILKFHNLTKDSSIGGVLFKDENYRKKLEKDLGMKIPSSIDLMSKGDKKQEIWNYKDTSVKIGMES